MQPEFIRKELVKLKDKELEVHVTHGNKAFVLNKYNKIDTGGIEDVNFSQVKPVTLRNRFYRYSALLKKATTDGKLIIQINPVFIDKSYINLKEISVTEIDNIVGTSFLLTLTKIQCFTFETLPHNPLGEIAFNDKIHKRTIQLTVYHPILKQGTINFSFFTSLDTLSYSERIDKSKSQKLIDNWDRNLSSKKYPTIKCVVTFDFPD